MQRTSRRLLIARSRPPEPGAPGALSAGAPGGGAPGGGALSAGASGRHLHLAPPFLVEEDYEPRAVRAAREGWLEGRVQQVELETAFKPSFQLLRPSALVMPCTAPPQAVASLASCLACPRNCAVDRLQDKRGACNTGRCQSSKPDVGNRFSPRKAIVSSAFPHFGEESVLQGWNGSGTVFFGEEQQLPHGTSRLS